MNGTTATAIPIKNPLKKINLLARIVCIADAFDAMTTQRPYRKTTLTQEEAIAELRVKSGTQFDPHLVEIFVSALQKIAQEDLNRIVIRLVC